MATSFEVLYLGTASEIDTTEGNSLSENDSALVGLTFGSTGNALAYNAQRDFAPDDYSGGTTDRWDIDNDLADDTFTIDGGSTQTFDGLAVYNATITYVDGTPDATITAVIFQDTAGNIYLAPEATANTDYTAMTAGPIESITLDSVVTITSGRMLADRQDTNFVCYAPGTMILTDRGETAVERLRPGDLVLTRDHGLQPVRWVHSATQPLEMAEIGAKPVMIRAGALGDGHPARDLIVSPQHRMLVGGDGQLSDLFESEALAPAKALSDLPGIRHMNGKHEITWIHFALDRHELVYANGCLSESLLLGPMATAGLAASELQELAALFDRAPPPRAALNGPPARTCLTVRDVQRQLAKRRRSKDRAAGKSNLWRTIPARLHNPAGRIDATWSTACAAGS